MEEKIKEEILNDLYETDSSLKKDEAEILKIITLILKTKNKVSYNNDYFGKLKKEIIQAIDKEKTSFERKHLFYKHLSYSLAVVCCCFLIIFLYPLFSQKDSKVLVVDNSQIIESTYPEAFGEISITKKDFVDGRGSGDISIMSEHQYKYILNDDYEINFDLAPTEVYKTMPSFNNFNRNINEIISLDSFENLQYSHISLTENKESPFSLYINYLNGSLTISKTMGNINSDINNISEEDILSLANNFINKHKINIDRYASPYINNNLSSSIAQVFYPQLIDNYLVYNDRGGFNSLQIDIDLNKNEVIALYNYNFNPYQASSYPIVNNKEHIQKYLNKLNQGNDPEQELLELNLIKPSFGLLKTFVPTDSVSETFHVPAIIFETDNDFQNKFVIPLLLSYHIEDVN